MAKLLNIDEELLKIINPGITEEQLKLEYDIYNGITISQKAKNRYPITEEEIDELIEKQSFIKILQAMDGNPYLNNFDVSKNVISYLTELSKPLEKIKIKKITCKPLEQIDGKRSKVKVDRLIFSLKNRDKLRNICHYISNHPDETKSKELTRSLEEIKGRIL